MPGQMQTVRGCGLWVEDTGGDGPIIAMSHGLLWSAEMYRPQIEALRDRYRIIAWDHRGQGRSEVPSGRDVSIEEVTSDAHALIESLGEPVHFVGLSMGGFVGMRMAARHPELVRSLILIETAPDPEPKAHLPKYGKLLWAARIMGVNSLLADRVLPIMVGDTVLNDPSRADDRERLKRQLMKNKRSIYKAVRGVLERDAVVSELKNIEAPTLVLHGAEDHAIARERARLLIEHIDGATWGDIPDAGHTSTLENPAAVTAAIEEFLNSLGTA